MGDFYQNGVITTLHNLSRRSIDELEKELLEFAQRRPMALVLPCLYSELEGPALSNIVDELCKVPYLSEIVIGLDRATESQYHHALEFFSRLPQSHVVLWNDGPRLQSIDARLKQQNLEPKEMGKGRNVWYCLGYVMASGKVESVALHDCDITTYNRELLARLIYPVANPNFNYEFCKGFYSRIANGAMNGRVCRLLVTPLLRALKKMFPSEDYIEYLDSYRYALAGEFSMRTDVIKNIRIPSDWGLEIGVLSEVKRNYSTNRLCQVDIADQYDHKHQVLSLNDEKQGLSKMSIDISKALFRKLATNGVVFYAETFRSIKATYYRIALDFIDTYHNDAVINGLKLDIHSEEQAVELFAENIMKAGLHFLENPMETPFIPSWTRVNSALPTLAEDFIKEVAEDIIQYRPKTINYMNTANHIEELNARIVNHVTQIYPDWNSGELSLRLIECMGLNEQCCEPKQRKNHWNEKDIAVITYANTFLQENEAPLKTLYRFLSDYLKESISIVHILPFFPSSSDDGFAVIDFTQVNDSHGDWDDIEQIAREFKLMSDLVINHCSSRSRWFEQFKTGQEPGNQYFFCASPQDDLSSVVRPRTSPLLREVLTPKGCAYVWCTFSHDQVDLNFSNPDVLLEIVKIIRFYLERGIRIFRLDAIAFLWKEIGTTCINLPQTHELVRLLRTLIQHHTDDAIIITETNLPNRENLTYFGNANEAHIIYNFSLPPLLLNTLVTGSSRHLKTWLMSMPPAMMGTTYLNFIASHDGIGLRPAEGLLSEEEIAELVAAMESFGGRISWRTLDTGGKKPYEINITLYDALKGTVSGKADQWQQQRFICAHAIMMALEGVPAFYIHSLLATENDVRKLENTGNNRAINRHNWQIDELKNLLATDSHHAKILNELKRLIEIRRKQPAFHPNATQFTLQLGDGICAFWRQNLTRDQSIFAINNITDKEQAIFLADINLIVTDKWMDLVSGDEITENQTLITLEPYQSVWLTNKLYPESHFEN